jgi:hypothetical protein
MIRCPPTQTSASRPKSSHSSDSATRSASSPPGSGSAIGIASFAPTSIESAPLSSKDSCLAGYREFPWSQKLAFVSAMSALPSSASSRNCAGASWKRSRRDFGPPSAEGPSRANPCPNAFAQHRGRGLDLPLLDATSSDPWKSPSFIPMTRAQTTRPGSAQRFRDLSEQHPNPGRSASLAAQRIQPFDLSAIVSRCA